MPVIINETLYILGGLGPGDNWRRATAVFNAELGSLSKHQLTWNTVEDTLWGCCAPVSLNNTELLVIGGGLGKVDQTSEVHKLN